MHRARITQLVQRFQLEQSQFPEPLFSDDEGGFADPDLPTDIADLFSRYCLLQRKQEPLLGELRSLPEFDLLVSHGYGSHIAPFFAAYEAAG
jgi:hypothetical protein